MRIPPTVIFALSALPVKAAVRKTRSLDLKGALSHVGS